MVFHKILTTSIAILTFLVVPSLISMEELASNLNKLIINLDNLHSILTQNMRKSPSNLNKLKIIDSKKISALEKPTIFYAITPLPGQEFIDAQLVQNLSNRLDLTLIQKKTTDNEWQGQKCPILLYYVPRNASNELEKFLDDPTLFKEDTLPIVILLKFPGYDYSNFSKPNYSNARLINLFINAEGGQLEDDINTDREIYTILFYLDKNCGKNLTASLEREKHNSIQKHQSQKMIEQKAINPVPPTQVHEQYQQLPIQYLPQKQTHFTSLNPVFYTIFNPNEAWVTRDFDKITISDLQNKLGIPLENVENSQFKDNPKTLYLYLNTTSRLGEDQNNIQKVLDEINRKNGKFLIIFNNNDLVVKKLNRLKPNNISYYIINTGSWGGILNTDHNNQEINKLKNALFS